MEKSGILFRVSGGFGKNLMATAVARAIKKANPDLPLHVQASYPDAFVNIDEVAKVYPQAPNVDFHDLHKNFEVIDAEPYVDHDYRRGDAHLVAAWCRRSGVKAPESPAGVIRLSRAEKKASEQIMGQIRQQAAGRPVVGFQWLGGTSFYAPQEASNPNRAAHVRELPQELAQEVANEIVGQGMIPVTIGLATEPRLANVIPLLDGQGQAFPIRVVLAVISLLDGLVAIDSFAQHAWVGLGKSGAVVLWGATRSENLGYTENTNLTAGANCCPTPGCRRPDTYLGDWAGNGAVWSCPHDGKCMAAYNAKDIVKKVTAAVKPPVAAPAPTEKEKAA